MQYKESATFTELLSNIREALNKHYSPDTVLELHTNLSSAYGLMPMVCADLESLEEYANENGFEVDMTEGDDLPENPTCGYYVEVIPSGFCAPVSGHIRALDGDHEAIKAQLITWIAEAHDAEQVVMMLEDMGLVEGDSFDEE